MHLNTLLMLNTERDRFWYTVREHGTSLSFVSTLGHIEVQKSHQRPSKNTILISFQ